jgi:hypothetical protein
MSASAILDLQRAGFSREQVEALGRLIETQAATKPDIGGLELKLAALELKVAQVKADLEIKIADTKSELIEWVVGVGFAQVATLIGALFAFLRLFPGGQP